MNTSKQTISKNYRAYTIALLTLVYGFNFIDRQIVGILAPFIQSDLGLTNTQLGLLIGLVFAIFYTVMGIPIAFMADRVNRVKLLSVSLMLWSGFTALTGFVQNFWQIGLARIGVGIGEAGGSPPSHTIISDMYTKEERAGALGIYSLGIPLGIMSAYFITAALLGADPSSVNWRLIFIILGITGIALAFLVFFTIKEPKRGSMEKTKSNEIKQVPFMEAVKTLLSIKSWWFMCLGIATASFVAYAFSGFQTKFIRLLDPEYDFRRVVIILGIIYGTFYVAGTYFGAKFVDWRAKTDVRVYGYLPAISVLLALPLGISCFWAPTVHLHFLLAGLFQFFIGVYLGPSFAIAQTLAPVHIRATSTALFSFIVNIIALGGGPTVAGILIDVFGDSNSELDAIKISMTLICGVFCLSIIFFMLVTRTLPIDWADAEARNDG
jgi:MFS family permease